MAGPGAEMAAGDAPPIGSIAPEVRRRILNRGPGICSVLALGGATAHDGRDGLAYADWDDTDPRPPQEIPLPPSSSS